MILFTRLWCISLFVTISSLISSSLWLGSICVLVGFNAKFLVSLWRFPSKFCCKIRIPFLECTTSIPKKYFNLPNFLISNILIKIVPKVCFSILSFHVLVILSTYTRLWLPWNLNAQWTTYDLPLSISMFFIIFTNLPNQTIGNCFHSYKSFHQFTHLFGGSMTLKSMWDFHIISCSRFLLRNSFLTYYSRL